MPTFEIELEQDLIELDTMSSMAMHLEELDGTDLSGVRPELLAVINGTVLGTDVVETLGLQETAGLEFLGKVKDALLTFWRAVIDFIKAIFNKIKGFFSSSKGAVADTHTASVEMKADDVLKALDDDSSEMKTRDSYTVELAKLDSFRKRAIKIKSAEDDKLADSTKTAQDLISLCVDYKDFATDTNLDAGKGVTSATMRQLSSKDNKAASTQNQSRGLLFKYASYSDIITEVAAVDKFIDGPLLARAEFYVVLTKTLTELSKAEAKDVPGIIKDLDLKSLDSKIASQTIEYADKAVSFTQNITKNGTSYGLSVTKAKYKPETIFKASTGDFVSPVALYEASDRWTSSKAFIAFEKAIANLDGQEKVLAKGSANLNSLISNKDLAEHKKDLLMLKSLSASVKSRLSQEASLIATLVSVNSRLFKFLVTAKLD